MSDTTSDQFSAPRGDLTSWRPDVRPAVRIAHLLPATLTDCWTDSNFFHKDNGPSCVNGNFRHLKPGHKIEATFYTLLTILYPTVNLLLGTEC